MGIEKKRVFIIQTFYLLIWAGLLFFALRYVLPLVTPFLLALLIACMLRPPILYLHKKGKLPMRLSAVLVVTVFYGLVGTMVCFSGAKLISTLSNTFADLPEIYAGYMEPWLMSAFDGVKRLLLKADAALLGNLESVSQQMLRASGELVSKASVWAMGQASGMALKLPKLLLELMLMIIATFFIALDYEKLQEYCQKRLSEKPRALALKVKDYVTGTLFKCLKAYLVIMTVTFIELALGLTLLKVDHALWIAGVIALFDILPVLGTGGIMLPWAGISLLQGQYGLAIGLGALYLVITVVRNIMEPKIVGAHLGLHPVVTLISMYVGVQVMGVAGLFGAPILLSLLQYIREDRAHMTADSD